MSYSGQIFVPPPSSGWSWYGTTGTATVNAKNAINLYVAKSGTANSDNCAGYYRTAPSTPYTIIGNATYNCVDINGASTLYLTPGLGFTDGTKSQFINPRLCDGTNYYSLCVTNFTNATTVSSNIGGFQQVSSALYPYATTQWYMIRDNGTNIYFYLSNDSQINGSDWVQICSVARTSFMTPSKVGVFWDARGNVDMNVTISSWQVLGV